MNEITQDRRDQIIDIIKREFIGPDPITEEGHAQPNGEEILFSDPPRTRYIAGIIYPRKTQDIQVEEVSETEAGALEEIPADEADESTGGQEQYGYTAPRESEEAEELLNLSNAYRPSAISITAAVIRGHKPFIKVTAGIYDKLNYEDGKTGNKKVCYPRIPIQWENGGNPLELPTSSARVKFSDFEQRVGVESKKMRFSVTYRYANSKYNSDVYTFTLENRNQASDGIIRDADCFFQVEFALFDMGGFSPLQDEQRIRRDEDYQSNQMLYHNVRTYATGHGCASNWKCEGEKIISVFTETFPTYEIKPILPAQIDGVSLDMFKMSDLGEFTETLTELKTLCSKYGEWIDGENGLVQQYEHDPELKDNHAEAAQRHIQNCRDCYNRMVEGVYLLETDNQVRAAFQFMNRAMLLQQLHYNLPLQEWKDDEYGDIQLVPAYDKMPDIMDFTTWYGSEKRVYGKWRPFQLAFILINLKAMTQKECGERSIVDLIWFPTGGGKTEAYLGLSAYTIFIRRLKDLGDKGTVIIMRYTLRLLTSQQYNRAAAMICACETIRWEKCGLLGASRITIGLWVGNTVTPGKMRDAVSAYNELYGRRSDNNPFVMLKCPWCGAHMGIYDMKHRNERRLPGYYKTHGRPSRIIFKCNNPQCDFSTEDHCLPLSVIDEDIFDQPPTLLLGTVDKFAMLPYNPDAQHIFGIYEHERRTPPDLIIQDELHLISGPLGSMVGHYETMIQDLCTDRRTGSEIPPKIIASTATISRAKEQCKALYGCKKEQVIQFPPSGLDAGDSFFAIENKDGVGRKYMGVFAPGASSFATMTIRLYATLLYAAPALVVSDENQRDPYWTNIGYFNSIRELGQAKTWIHADIDEYLHVIYKRRFEDKRPDYKETRRYIWRDEELTSRIPGDKISESLQNLEVSYPSKKGFPHPIDICLATNMISVGVDIPRLGLMTVIGQPKTTSEYIQATSRVGRADNKPGLVITSYHPGKPRDKSHYEQFRDYHSRIYCRVEPTSVTPYSAPLRERALHAILIGLYRLYGDAARNSDPPKIPSSEEIEWLFSIVEKRVRETDDSELEDTIKRMQEIISDWSVQGAQKYADYRTGDQVPLMFPAGSSRNIKWGPRGMPTPTSMRSVDISCEVRQLPREYSPEEE